MRTNLLPNCLCGWAGVFIEQHNGIPTLRCGKCDIVRQDVDMTEDELAGWYANYFNGTYTHTREHDVEVAEKRLKAYNLKPGLKLLDVGAGNGAFVAMAKVYGLDSWGQDLSPASESPLIYTGKLADVAFPTADFDVVTIHDVLEHVIDPVSFLEEVKRILKPGGMLIVDFPRFWDEAGQHHWKKIEHLWMLTGNQLIGLLQRVGFEIEDVTNPIPSKIVVRSLAPQVTRTRILVPAGIGDAYWVLIKLKGFLKEHGITIPPDIIVQDAGGPKRTHPFVRTVPFVHAGGYELLRTRHNIWKMAYLTDGPTTYKDPFPNIDWFIAYNGVMRYGKSLAEVDPAWEPDWHMRLHVTKEMLQFKAACEAGGPYCIVYLTDGGMYQDWLRAFTPEQICATLKLIERKYGYRMIFIGAEWDREMTGERLAQHGDPKWVDLVGETTYDQMIGAILGAKLVFGYPAGNTILATAYKVPTVLLWHSYFDHRFWINACAPEAPYVALDVAGLTPEAALEAVDQALDASLPYATL